MKKKNKEDNNIVKDIDNEGKTLSIINETPSTEKVKETIEKFIRPKATDDDLEIEKEKPSQTYNGTTEEEFKKFMGLYKTEEEEKAEKEKAKRIEEAAVKKRVAKELAIKEEKKKRKRKAKEKRDAVKSFARRYVEYKIRSIGYLFKFWFHSTLWLIFSGPKKPTGFPHSVKNYPNFKEMERTLIELERRRVQKIKEKEC